MRRGKYRNEYLMVDSDDQDVAKDMLDSIERTVAELADDLAEYRRWEVAELPDKLDDIYDRIKTLADELY